MLAGSGLVTFSGMEDAMASTQSETQALLTTMLKKVVYVAVLVSDQDKALDFYTNVIGLEKRGDYPTPDGPRFLTVGVKGQDFELVLWPGTPGKAKAGFRCLHHRGGKLPDGVRDAQVARSEIRATRDPRVPAGLRSEVPKIRTGICFRCERVAGHLGAEGAQIATGG